MWLRKYFKLSRNWLSRRVVPPIWVPVVLTSAMLLWSLCTASMHYSITENTPDTERLLDLLWQVETALCAAFIPLLIMAVQRDRDVLETPSAEAILQSTQMARILVVSLVLNVKIGFDSMVASTGENLTVDIVLSILLTLALAIYGCRLMSFLIYQSKVWSAVVDLTLSHVADIVDMERKISLRQRKLDSFIKGSPHTMKGAGLLLARPFRVKGKGVILNVRTRCLKRAEKYLVKQLARNRNQHPIDDEPLIWINAQIGQRLFEPNRDTIASIDSALLPHRQLKKLARLLKQSFHLSERGETIGEKLDQELRFIRVHLTRCIQMGDVDRSERVFDLMRRVFTVEHAGCRSDEEDS